MDRKYGTNRKKTRPKRKRIISDEDDLLPSMSTSQIQAMESALTNPLILQTIINCLDFPDLKTCRMVRKNWCALSTETLLTQNSPHISFWFDPDLQKYCSTTTKGHNKLLKNFLPLFKKSLKFPLTHFEFDDGDLSDRELRHFFKYFGDQIKSLQLSEVQTKSATILPMILLMTPNLENLKMDDDPFNEARYKENELVIPKLKCLPWGKCTGTSISILKSNVQNLLTFNPGPAFNEHLSILKEAKRGDLLQNFYCNHFGSEFPLQVVQKLSPEIKFKSINLTNYTEYAGYNNEEGKGAFKIIMDCCKDTVEFLTLENGFINNVGLPLPILKNVKTLKVHYRKEGNNGLLTYGNNLKNTFPHLRVLDLRDLSNTERLVWEKIFTPCDSYSGRLEGVKQLKINSEFTEKWMTKLQELCPNFTQLVVQCGWGKSGFQKPVIFQRIFYLWKHLETIHVTLNDGGGGFEYFWMDSELTGLSVEVCNQYRRMGVMEEESGVKRISGICELKYLKVLRVSLNPVDGPPFSTVSRNFGFKFMPNLKIIVEIEWKSSRLKDVKLIWETLGEFTNCGSTSQ